MGEEKDQKSAGFAGESALFDYVLLDTCNYDFDIYRLFGSNQWNCQKGCKKRISGI